MDALRRASVIGRAHLAAWRVHGQHVRAHHGHTLASLVLVVLGLGGALAGGALIGEWCLGLVLIAESCGAVWFGLFRDDGRRPAPAVEGLTVQQVLARARHVP